MLIDTHAHLNMDRFDEDREAVIRRARRAGLTAILDVGTDLASSSKAVGLSRIFPEVYAVTGVHPHDAAGMEKDDFERLRRLLKEKKTVALGETGLDYYYEHSPRNVQKEIFEKQLRLAREVDKPVVIHVREAMEDALSVIDRVSSSGWRGVFHCFSGGKEDVEPVLNRGFYISFTGVITFKNFTGKDILKSIPAERLLLETDCPFMAPEPYRGKRCEPAHVRETAVRAAEFLGTGIEDLARKTSANARSLFGL